MMPRFAVAAVAALLAAPALAGPGRGPDPSLAAITPVAERLDVGLAGEMPADIARYVLANGARSASLSPDGRHVAVLSSLTGLRQLWIVPAGGGQPRQLSFGNGVTDWRWAPDGQSLVYAADNDGNEQEAFYRISTDGRRETRVVPAKDGAFRVMGDVLPDNRRIVFASTERNGLDYDVFIRDLHTGEQSLVHEGRYLWYPQPVSPDGRWLLLTEAVGADSDNLYLVDMARGGTRVVSTPRRRASHAAGGFAWLPDSSGFYFATNAGRDFAALARHDLASGRTEIVAEAPHDIQNVQLCGGGQYLLWTTNEDGVFRLHGRDLVRGELLIPPSVPEGVFALSCPAGSEVAVIHVNGWATPGDVYAWDLVAGRATTVWASNLAGLDPAGLVRPLSLRTKARDGVELQGLLYLPKAARNGGDAPPVVFDVHGGPTLQALADYRGYVQYLVNRGIAVFRPNVRGSRGFGHRYTTLDDRERRLDSIRDLVDLLAYLRSDGRVDASRAAVRGDSYGGYAVNAALSAYPGEFVAGVALYGVADWVTALEVASPALKAADRVEFGDIADPKWRDFYARISPIRQADRIRVPVLYSHGEQDPRIDIFETETMVRTLRGNGVEAPYIRFPDEGHGWRKLANQLFYYRREAEFLEEQLGMAGAAP